MPGAEHRTKHVDSVACAILTVSDTRTLDTDESGGLIRDALETAGNHIVSYSIVRDEPAEVRTCVLGFCSNDQCRAVLISGGTGLAPRDTTYEAISSLLDKKLDGFGELFRALSYEEIGSPAMLSRAVAGVRGQTLIFSMPGSPAAVRLAMTKLIIPELGHLARLVGDS